MKDKALLRRYEKNCNEIVEVFAQKQDLYFEFWIGNKVGETACFSNEFFFNFTDIVLDLTSNSPAGLILAWLKDDFEHNAEREDRQYINYNSYVMGLRHKDLSKRECI